MTWPKVKLGDLIKPAKPRKAGDKSYPILSMTMHKGLVDQADKFKKRIASLDTSPYKVVCENQLVVGFPIDEGVLSFQNLYPEAIVSPAYNIWDVRDLNLIDVVYFEKLLRSPQSLSFYASKLRGSTARRRSLPNDTFLSLEIPLPPLYEQKRLATILDRADSLRQARRQSLRVLDELAQSLFLELFGDPATNPKDWEVVKLGEAVRFRTGRLDSNAAEADGKYPFFTCSREDFRINEYAFDCEALLLAGNNASADYSIKHYKGKFNAYQRTYVIELLNPEHSYDYMKKVLEMKLQEMKRMSKGTNTKYLTLVLLKDLNILLPPLELQQRFAEQIEELEAIKRRARVSLLELDALFACLQARAFAGELSDEKN